jgi:hypothetical protein
LEVAEEVAAMVRPKRLDLTIRPKKRGAGISSAPFDFVLLVESVQGSKTNAADIFTGAEGEAKLKALLAAQPKNKK